MPTESELYYYLDSLIPKSLSCDWDNDGLLCCASPKKEVKKLLITLDITDSAIEYATTNGFDTILSHHPLIFNSLKSVNTESGISSRVIKLIRANITAMSFHTRLDAVKGGVNDTLAAALGLMEVEPFVSEGIEIGRVGKLCRQMSANELAEYIKKVLNAPYVNYNGRIEKIEWLAVLGGSGKDDIAAAAQTKAQAFLTGELGHHALTDACDSSINLYEAGHHYTEFPVCNALFKMVNEKYPEINAEIFNSVCIKCI